MFALRKNYVYLQNGFLIMLTEEDERLFYIPLKSKSSFSFRAISFCTLKREKGKVIDVSTS